MLGLADSFESNSNYAQGCKGKYASNEWKVSQQRHRHQKDNQMENLELKNRVSKIKFRFYWMSLTT